MHRFAACALLVTLASPLRPTCAADQPPEPIVLTVTVNYEEKGSFFLFLRPDGDILVKRSDLEKMGFRDPQGEVVRIEGEDHISLRSMRSVAFRRDEATVSLKIAAAARLLQVRTIDFAFAGSRVGERPTNGSFFFNYGAQYLDGGSAEPHWQFTGEAGGRIGETLLITDGISQLSRGGKGESTRLMSRLIHDDRDAMRRLTIGDATASSGDLGGTVVMGGVGWEKKYDLDPHVVKNPVFGLSGVSPLPAELEITVNGVTVRREKISPGEFEIRNLWQYRGQAEVGVTIRDIFGGTTTLGQGVYFSDTLLRQGAQEYAYRAGFLRRNFGEESSDYGGAAFSVYHRLGLTDTLTAGLAGEGSGDLLNAGPSMNFPLGSLGQVTVAARLSRHEGREGGAGLASYSVFGDRLSAAIHATKQSRDYTRLETNEAATHDEFSYSAGLNYQSRRLGALSLGYALEKSFDGENRTSTTLSYARNLTSSISLYLQLKNEREESSENSVLLTLTWSGKRDSVSGRYEQQGGDAVSGVEIYRDAPEGVGYGYRTRASSQGEVSSLDAALQYNGSHATWRGSWLGTVLDEQRSASWDLSWAGSLVAVEGSLRLGRPVRDAFGLVKVDGLEGIPVLRNNEAIGRTDRDGTVLVPSLSSFHDNEIAIDNRAVPMNYTIAALKKYVSPAYRQGALVRFDVARFQAISGFLQAQTDNGLRPLEFGEGTLTVAGKSVVFPLGKGGEFYLENIPPGSHEATVAWEGKEGRCGILVPASEETVLDLGTIACEIR